GQAGAPPLQPFLELGAGAAGGSGLLQRRSTLFLGELGKCHVFLRLNSNSSTGAVTVPSRRTTPQHGVAPISGRSASKSARSAHYTTRGGQEHSSQIIS